MNLDAAFRKALIYLDTGKDEAAKELLDAIYEESLATDDALHLVQSSCALGQYYYNRDEFIQARHYLNITVSTQLEEGLDDLLAYEINVANELLLELDAKN
ncbi:hypothetical protein [Chitinophaga sp. Cy-1792]|uniref:hypothetical protein n=1 Tax=Chitinophaga sp. Cy-1792 TaxID=2608339 RepID=UPI001420BEF4|nr:hypothetical protein [Chitinophaga sp. Cy-1792]NIG55091.1 hypothetical protein [Chitinophaga sp. Cy-1792]